jgi:hypothetical protein
MFVFITWSSALRLGVRIVLEICTRGVGPKVYLGTAEALECCLAVSDGLWHAVDSLRFENVIFKNHHSLLPIFGRSETQIDLTIRHRKKLLPSTIQWKTSQKNKLLKYLPEFRYMKRFELWIFRIDVSPLYTDIADTLN